MSIIYKTTNVVNGKYYVGKHQTSADDGYLGSGLILWQAIEKYGKENFIRETIEFCNEDIVNEREIFWIKELSATVRGIGYNITFGGTGGDTFTNNPNKEILRIKCSKIFKGKKHSDEVKKKLSILRTGEGNGMFQRKPWNKGIPMTIEQKEKLRNANLGKKLTEEHKQKISISNIGKSKPKTEGHRRKISETLTGRKLPKETCIKMSEARKGIPQTKIKCPYCGKEGGTTMYRWHFENCKEKNK